MQRAIVCLWLVLACPALAGEAYVDAEGAVTVIGYNDMRESLTALNQAFTATHPGIRFDMVLEGTRTAPDALARGISAFAPMGAEFSDDELARYRAAVGADPVMIRVAHDSLNPEARSAPLAIFVNKDNPLAALTMDQVRRIFAQGPSGRAIERWEQLGRARGEIHPVGLAPDTALGLFLRKHKLNDQSYRANVAGYPQSRDVVRVVGEDPLAIGFAAMNQVTPQVKALALAETAADRPSAGSAADLVAGIYPLDRTLYIFARRPPGGRIDPLVRDYLDLVLSDQGQGLIAAGKLGYLPLNPAERAAERAKLASAGGSGMTCVGADTMRALARSWAESFNRAHPAMPVALDDTTSLSAEGFERLLAGTADCVTYVREPFPAELDAYKAKFGGAPLVLNVAGGSYATRGGTHAIAIYVNAANPLSRLTLQQLDAIFSQERRRGGAQALRSWGQLGLDGAWADRPIHPYGMLRRRDSGNPPGVVNFLQQRVLLGGEFRDDLREQADRPGETALAAIVHRVAEDPDGIGFSGFGFAEAGVKSLSLAESAEDPDYPGTPETVASRLYPLSRSLYLMVRPAEQGTLSAAQRAFLDSVLAEAGQHAVAVDSEGFLPLTPAQLAAAKAVLAHYSAHGS